MRAGRSLLVALSFLALGVLTRSSGVEISNRCELITIAVCADIPYNHTIYPNILGHTKQDETMSEITQYAPLVSKGNKSIFKQTILRSN
jgi:hypothetical protein